MQVATQREVYETLHRNWKKHSDSNPDMSPAASFDELVWAIQAVRSRAFGGPFPGDLVHVHG